MLELAEWKGAKTVSEKKRRHRSVRRFIWWRRRWRRATGNEARTLNERLQSAFGTIVQVFWYALVAVVVGVTVGAVTALFGHGLLLVNEWREAHLFWFVPFLGLAGLVIMSVNMHWGGAAQRGMGLVFDVGLGRESTIPLRMVPLTIFATWMTHLFGGSAGREGVAVQIGSTISMQFARFAPRRVPSHVILASGMAAGFAGLFGTPIAATFFALEVLVVGSVYYEALAPALIAAYCASFTARSLGLMAMAMPIGPVPDMDARLMVLTLLAGVLFGAVGWFFSWLLNHLRIFFALLIDDPRLRIFIIGSLLAVVFLLLDGRYSGLSDALFMNAFTGGDVYALDWLFKLVLTAMTLAAGFQGGELTPLFVIGATLGSFLALALGLPVALFAAMGCVAVFGAATKTMFAPLFIGVEVFGAQGMPFFAVVAITAFVVSGHRGIYNKQRFLREAAHVTEETK